MEAIRCKEILVSLDILSFGIYLFRELRLNYGAKSRV